jgi:hypothetical protein
VNDEERGIIFLSFASVYWYRERWIAKL